MITTKPTQRHHHHAEQESPNHDHQLVALQKKAQTKLEELQSNLQTMWSDSLALPLPAVQKVNLLQLPEGKPVQNLSQELQEKLKDAVVAQMKKFAKKVQSSMVPKVSDPHYAGNCFCHLYGGHIPSAAVKFECLSIFSHQTACSVIHTQHMKDGKVHHDGLFFHVYDAKGTSLFLDCESSAPSAVLVPSTCKSLGDVQAIERKVREKGDVLDHITNAALVSMVYYRCFSRQSAHRYTPLQGMHAGNLAWIYAVDAGNGRVDFILCRKQNLEMYRMNRDVNSLKEAGKIEDAMHREQMYNDEHKKVPMTTTFPDKAIRQAISKADGDAGKDVSKKYKEYKDAK